MTKLEPPKPRKETKLSCLTLLWPVTKTLGTIAIYKLDASGLHRIRVLHGCKVYAGGRNDHA